MAGKGPTVVITDKDGTELVRDELGSPPVPVRASVAPVPGHFEIRRRDRLHHATYEIWVPDILMVEAPVEVVGMLASDDLSRVVLGLYKLTKLALRIEQSGGDDEG